jgi:hypothetical protein
MLFITVRSASPADVPRVLQVVDQVKRLRHKRGTYPVSLPASPRSHIPSLHRSKRRRTTRRAQPIRRLRRPTTRPTAHQARRPPGERIHAPDEPNSPPKQDPNARTVSAARGAKRPAPASAAATRASSTRLPDAQVSVWPGPAATASASRAHPATEGAQVADGVRVAAAFSGSDPVLTTPDSPAVVAW